MRYDLEIWSVHPYRADEQGSADLFCKVCGSSPIAPKGRGPTKQVRATPPHAGAVQSVAWSTGAWAVGGFAT